MGALQNFFSSLFGGQQQNPNGFKSCKFCWYSQYGGVTCQKTVPPTTIVNGVFNAQNCDSYTVEAPQTPVSAAVGAVTVAVQTVKGATDSVKTSLDLLNDKTDLVKASTDGITATLGATNTKLDSVKGSTDGITASISGTGGVVEKLTAVKTSVDTTASNVSAVQTAVGNVQTAVNSTNTALGTTNTKLDTVASDITALPKKILSSGADNVFAQDTSNPSNANTGAWLLLKTLTLQRGNASRVVQSAFFGCYQY